MQSASSIESITAFLFCAETPKTADLALVLGCPSLTNMDPAIDLYRKGLAGRIVISGHGPSDAAEPEWRAYRDYALAQGVPESALLIEPKATNTRENLLFSEALIDREIGWRNVNSLALATKPVHARRALMTARRVLPPHVALSVLAPDDPRDIQAANWWRTERGRQRVFQEIQRIGEYALKDHLHER